MMEPAPSRTVWQISAGGVTRPYDDFLLRFGVALLGPGDAGLWNIERTDEEFEGSFVRRFASEVQVGDGILLRVSRSAIRAVGIIASEYMYLNQFDDVNGLDLQHVRRVRWFRLPQDHVFDTSVFGPYAPRFSKVHNAELTTYAQTFIKSPPTYWQTAPLPTLPEEEPALEEVPLYLQSVVAEVKDLHPLLWDKVQFGPRPTEDELVGHFVLPFLRASGWPPERIAVKWRAIDVALFGTLPRTPENCVLVIEAKRIGAGVEAALSQARSYVEALGKPCDIVVTDGVRYRMYGCQTDFGPVAYANIARLKVSALDLFSRLKRP